MHRRLCRTLVEPVNQAEHLIEQNAMQPKHYAHDATGEACMQNWRFLLVHMMAAIVSAVKHSP